ncbi:MAG: hypothetical protein J6P61_09420 [Erysipelotrichaceae bacterium]|nr:hypothetical protein [Erysipelotrichaceae bacterium]
MIGRQVLTIKKAITLQELEQIMQKNWDKEQYGHFVIGKPTKASIEEYILLPATRRFLIIVYPRAAGGLFSKENKVILSTADSPEGAKIAIAEYFPTRGPLTKVLQTKSVLSSEKERKGPAEEALQAYTAHMREILDKQGLLK